MTTIAPAGSDWQAPGAVARSRVEASSYGGVLLLAQAWGALGASERLMEGLRWQGQGGEVLLFVLVGLPLLAVKSVRALAGACAQSADPLMAALGWGTVATQRRLARFVDSGRHYWMEALGAMAGVLAHHPLTALGREGIISVDSTTVEKRYGPRLAGSGPVYDAVSKRVVDGYEIVSAYLVGEQGVIPLGLAPHGQAGADSKRRRRRAQAGERPSKLDLALELVRMALKVGATAPTVVGDGAFCVMWWLREVAALGQHWLVASRQDRRLRIGATIQPYRVWLEELPLELVEQGDKGSLYGVLLPQAVLLERHRRRKGLDCRPAYFERRNRHGRVLHRWHLVTSHLDWSLEQVWRQWGRRWKIEQLHRDAKQCLLLDQFHVRTWEGIVALVACTSLRASLLYFMRAADPVCGALSIPALAPALGRAACSATVPPEHAGPCRFRIPPTLPAATLWDQHQPPFPAQYWPITLDAA